MWKFDDGDGRDGGEELRCEIRVKKPWCEARRDRKMIEWENSCFVLIKKFDGGDGGEERQNEEMRGTGDREIGDERERESCFRF